MTKSSTDRHPYILGFDPSEDRLQRARRGASQGYPPYNIEVGPGGRYRITLAVAGFNHSELLVEVEDGDVLRISGGGDPAQAPEQEPKFLHRGIGKRRFQCVFILADGVQVDSAELHAGLLKVSLTKPPRAVGVRKIEILPT